MKLKQIILFITILLPQILSSQTKEYPNNYFLSPIEMPISTSGYFAELRANHFHSGIDIRIGEKEGEKVFSPEDGEGSRLKIQAF